MSSATTDTLTTRNPTGKYYGFWSITSLALWVILWAVFLPWPVYGVWILLATYVLADVGSYVFHYYYDHYADPGRSEIAHAFQWHHIDPGAAQLVGIQRRGPAQERHGVPVLDHQTSELLRSPRREAGISARSEDVDAPTHRSHRPG